MKNKNILILNRVYPPHHGATGRMARNLANHLSDNGWSVQVVCTGERSEEIKEQNVTITKVKAPQNPEGSFRYFLIGLKLFMKAMRKDKPDIVISMTDPPMSVVLGSLISKFKTAKHIHWCHDVYPDLLPLFKARIPAFIQKKFHKSSRRRMNKADKVIVIGRCMNKRLAKTGVDQTNIKIIPNWSNPSIFKPEDKSAELLVPKAEMPENMFRDDSPKFRVLYAGNIGKAHDVDVFLKTAALLQERKEIEFVFVGTSKAHEALAQERAKIGLDNIKFMPYQPSHSLRAVLETGDLHIVSMKPGMEGLLVPCKFYSSLNVGRPTLFFGSKHSEIGQVIEEYKTGSIVEKLDPDALARAILEYRNDGDVWYRAQQGAIEAGQIYNPENSLKAWEETLVKVLEGA